MLLDAVWVAARRSRVALLLSLFVACAPRPTSDASSANDALVPAEAAVEADVTTPVDASDAAAICLAQDAFAWGRGGADMLPGSDCLSCHRADAAASSFAFTAAGTVFSSPSCRDGVREVTVLIRDSVGREARMTTSELGNFSTSVALVPPLRASVLRDGRTITMRADVDHGSCNSCHRVDRPLGLLPAP